MVYKGVYADGSSEKDYYLHFPAVAARRGQDDEICTYLRSNTQAQLKSVAMKGSGAETI